ncbi:MULTISPECIES: DUF2612 domain-containing protein [Bacillus]|uniref:DUF2612 domain-containing protein n=1 Tax=Bacillus TaxID=1386 RepID=UPI000A08E950|nr:MULTISPECIES: DUF2612 domain-containing protein [Bacillus subtilis group]MBJ3766989.1 DUF2612 domain-containing protein [Bacillus subtilis]MCY7683122.1 DUF2612 domain-containing protein [Bacillus velezensis]MDI6685454.1 DUF2612 domain-containing protein [Bacillus subtilis]MEC0284954.1 DUF2612 domain-containing protein [Bacillus subtilis]MEC0451511.1 DUF2612 domain-containing protein [Bacillus subtilis]
MIKDLIGKLTDAFLKDEKSNIGKLFLIVDEQLTALKSALITAENWRDIDAAKGKALDLLGDNVSQDRGRATDEIYRVLIRGKIARNVSDGTTNRIIEALAKTLNCKPSEIHIVSSKENNEDEPAAIIVKKAPIEALSKVGMSATQFSNIVQKTVAAGVRVAYVDLNGTFRFSSSANSIETSQYGFSTDGTDGGTLGGIFQPEDDYPLPI